MRRDRRAATAAPPTAGGQPASGRSRATWIGLGTVAVVATVVTAWLLAGAPLGAGPSVPLAVVQDEVRSGAIVVSPPRFDAGDVFMDVSEVAMSFDVTNTGERVAVITYIETSCDCTKATILFEGREGPRFAMRHDTPPGTYDWRAVLAPGETVELRVYYDPQAHGVFTPEDAPAIHGPITRVVRLHSDDPQDPFVDLRIDLNQRH